jgi:hypothetical protein
VSTTSEIAYTIGTWRLIAVLAIGASVLLEGHTGTGPGRSGRRSGCALGWRWVLRRERSRARERELQLLSCVQAQIVITWLTGQNPRRSPDVLDILHRLGNAAFDADLIGAWDKLTRPYIFETRGGDYRFGLPQS